MLHLLAEDVMATACHLLRATATRCAAFGLLAILLATGARAEGSDQEVEAASPPSAPSPGPPPRPTGVFSLEIMGGTGAVGTGFGLRASLGAEVGNGWRVELGGGGWTEVGALGSFPGDYMVSRALVDLTLARRFGRVEPWVAMGFAKVSVDGDVSGAESSCARPVGCVWYGGTTPPGEATATGPALSLGVRLFLTDHLMIGATLREVFVTDLQLTDGGQGSAGAGNLPVASVGAPWLGLTVGWRFGGG